MGGHSSANLAGENTPNYISPAARLAPRSAISEWPSRSSTNEPANLSQIRAIAIPMPVI